MAVINNEEKHHAPALLSADHMGVRRACSVDYQTFGTRPRETSCQPMIAGPKDGLMCKRCWTFWAISLGFALGGFFDGILLHQILQWHHLLSLVPGISTIRLQVLWDGYFHALMYVIAAVSLAGLWYSRGSLTERWGSQTVGALFVGFGIWHIVDSVLSHWALGIHRIKLDSPNPLMWDLIWFVAFGLAPLLLGTFLVRRKTRPPAVRPAVMTLVPLGLITLASGVWSLQPPPDQPDFTTVVFRPGMGPEGAARAMAATDARLVWTDPDMSVVVLSVDPDSRWLLYRYGALLVSGAGAPAGCFNWSRAEV